MRYIFLVKRGEFDITSVPVALYQEKGSRYRFRGERHHGLYEIFCLDRGRAYVRVERQRYYARPGDCFLYPAGAFHQHQATRGHAPHYITVAFLAKGGAAFKPLYGRAWPLPATLRTLLARVVGAEHPPQPAPATLQRALLMQFLAEWLAQAAGVGALQARSATSLETYHHNAAQQTVRKALDYLDAHLAEDLSLEVAARAAGVSPPYLRQLVRGQLGHALREELKRRRIRRAKHLLSTGTGNIKEAAAAVGYASPAAFSRAFHAVEGLSPSAYARTVAARGPTPLPQGFSATRTRAKSR